MEWQNEGANPFDSRNQEINSHPEHRPQAAQESPPLQTQDSRYQNNGNSNNRGNYNNGNGYSGSGGGGQGASAPSGNSNGGGYSNGGNRSGYGNSGGGSRPPYSGGGQGGGNRFAPKKLTEQELADYKLYKVVTITGEKGMPEGRVADLIKVLRQAQEFDFTIRSTPLSELEETVARNANPKLFEYVLPFKGFNEIESKFTYTPDEAKELAKRSHPAYGGLKPFPQTICATKVRLVLGKDLRSPAQLLIIWTQDGAESIRDCTPQTGLTRVALDLACQLRIPVINLQRPDSAERILSFLNQG